MVGTARVGRLPGRLIKGAGMILKIVFLLLLLASPCFAQQQMAMNVAVIGAGAAAAPSCTTANDSKLVDKQPGTTEGAYGYQWNGTKITLGATTTITEYTALACLNNGTGNVWVELWTDDGGSPSKPAALVSGSNSATIDIETLVACEGTTSSTFTLATPKTGVAAGTYWIMNRHPDSNCHSQYKSSAGDRICRSDDGAAWTCFDDYVLNHALYGCQ
jgi:hypothetical protein